MLVVLGALALFLSYPPFPLPFLSFLAITPAVLLVRRSELEANPRGAFRWGWWYGLITNALVLYWMVVALWHFTPFSALGYLATCAIIGLLTGVMFWFVVRLRLALPGIPLWVVLPVAWTTLEWLIGHLGDVRFPWLGLGTSLADARVLVQWADVAGARGVTLWLAWCNVVIVEAAMGIREPAPSAARALPYIARRLAPVLVTLVLALGYGLWRMKTLPVRDVGVIGMVQPSEGFDEKFDPARADSVVGKLLSHSRRLLESTPRPQLIIWPEAAIPDFLWRRPRWEAAITGLVRESKIPIFTGVVWAEPGWRSQLDPYYNAAFLVDSTGDWKSHPIYAKHYLVPVTERVPFVPVKVFRAIPGLSRWSGGFTPGKIEPIYQTALGRFGVIVCYESAFEDLPRRYRANGADYLVNITNDAWFGRTTAPAQHASHLVLRAIETRMGVARAANSGISEFVDPLGRAYDRTRLDADTVIAGTLVTSDVVPVYVRLGDWVGVLVVVFTLAGTAFLIKKRFRP
ncbi:MAG TPA: apolipoprotein N-acyltransferase [Gemmatimonadales bacterium]|nr:apolipoprotein N-acyltransferase [Gemmatimonadales bacterium]